MGLLPQEQGLPDTPRIIAVFWLPFLSPRLYERGREVAVFASHPPGDVKYREDLLKAIIGEWEVDECRPTKGLTQGLDPASK